MYDISRLSNPSLCEFTNSLLCYYLPKSGTIQLVQKKPHHYQKQTNIVQLIDNICRQLFYYSNSLQKVSSKEDESMVHNILLENIKRIIIHNGDKYGLIPEQKFFYLIVSYLHSRHNGVNNLREYLNEVHYFLTSNVFANPNEQLPFSLVMLLNGQFEELLNYAKQQLIFKSQGIHIQYLIDILVYKLQEQDNNHKKHSSNTSVGTLIELINQSDWVKQLKTSNKLKNGSAFSLFETDRQLQMILAILAGNQTVIEEVSKGSWGIYLNLHINFIDKLQPKNSIPQSLQSTVRTYLQKYYANKNKKPTQHQGEQFFIINLLNTFSQTNRFSFHQIYQSSFSIFSPILSNIIGMLLLESKVVDLFSIMNNKEYYEEILLNLVDNCNALSWSSFVHIIGFVQNASYFKEFSSKETMWQNFLLQHLPYELQTNDKTNLLQNQVKQIQQKLEDLNMIGLSSFTKSYLNILFHLQLKPANSKGKLNQSILEIFFLTLEMSDSSSANSCFHQMKTFMAQYYRNYYFNYQLLQYLENIFERKQRILSQKMESKIQKLFCLPYKIKRIYQIANQQIDNEQQSYNHLLQQLRQFNALFITTKNVKKISLCVSLLQLASHLHQKMQNTLNLAQQVDMNERQGQTVDKLKQQAKLVKQFQHNLFEYLQQWKIYDHQNMQNQGLTQDSFKELNYFNQYFY